MGQINNGSGGGGGGAPTTAEYIVKVPNASLSAEFALSTLASGILAVENGTGNLSSITTSAGLAALISDATGSGGLVFANSPTLTTPTIASFVNANHDHLNSAGGGTLTAAAISDFNTAVRLNRLDQMAVPTGSVSMNSQKITSLGTPTADTDAVTKAYADALMQGLDIKASVRVATTADLSTTYDGGAKTLTATSNGAISVDGVSLSSGDRVLVKDQSTGSQNGIYTVTTVGTAGTPFVLTRATDADSSAEVTSGMFTFVGEGTANADSGWVLTTNDPITLDTTALVFTQFSGAGQITAGAGLTKTGNTLDVGAGTGITVNANDIAIDTAVVLTLTGVQNVTNKTLDSTNTITLLDTLFTLQDNSDPTKQARFQIAGITAGQTRTFTLPDVSDTLVSLTATQTLTNKTATSLAVNGTSSLTITQTVATSGSPFALRINGAAHTTLTATVEAIDLDINLARTVQFATGAITTQRAVYIQAPTYAFVGASVITNAATFFVSGAPVAGTNATITNSYAIYSNGATFVNGALTANTTLTVNGLATITAGLTISGSANITVSTSGNLNFGAAFGTVNFTSAAPHIAANTSSITLTLEGSRIATSTSADITLKSVSARTNGSLLTIVNDSTTRVTVEYNGGILVSQAAATNSNGTRALLSLTGGAHTSQTASTELNDVYFNLARTVQFSTGALTTQRAVRITAPTYSFVGSSTITDAATFYISGAPVAGTNATITSPWAMWIDAGESRFDGLLDLTNIAAGSPNFRITATSDTPGVTWGAAAGNEASAAPAGYIEISVGGAARYVPFWA